MSHLNSSSHAPKREFGFYKSLRTLSVAIFACIGIVSLSALQFYWLPRLSTTMIDNQTEELTNQVDLLGDTLVPYILGNEFEGAYSTIEAQISKRDNWLDVQLFQRDGRRIFPLAEPELITAPDAIAISTILSSGLKYIGDLTVLIDLSEDLEAIQKEVRAIFYSLSFVFLIILLLVAFAVDRFIVRPLTTLMRATQEMKAGNFGARVPESKINELEALTRSFREMRSQIWTNEQSLVTARNAAEELVRSKARFLAVMSHEIRTPLNGILGTLDLLSQSELNRDQRRYLDLSILSGNKLLSQVSDVLSIAHLEAKQGVESYVPVDMNKLSQGVLDIFRSGPETRDTIIKFLPCDPENAVALTEPNYLRHILQNLLSNAVKFTPDGDVTLSIQYNSERNLYKIEVADTGIGIAAENLAHIWDDFVSIPQDGVSHNEGTGLGLGITRRLVHALGGIINCESRLGSGTTFTLYFSFQPTTLRSSGSIESASAADDLRLQIAKLDQQPPQILAVEDNQINMLVLRKMCENVGFEVTTAEDGAKGWELAQQVEYALIITDIMMPKMTGVELLNHIRNDPAGPNANTPVLAVTANVFFSDLTDEDSAKFTAVTTKPFNLEALSLGILKALNPPPVNGDPLPVTNMTSDLDALVDFEQFEELKEQLGETLFESSLNEYRDSADVFFEMIANGSLTPRSKEFPLLTHNFVGAGGMMGIASFAEQMREIETNARNGVFVNSATDLEQAAKTWTETKALVTDETGMWAE